MQKEKKDKKEDDDDDKVVATKLDSDTPSRLMLAYVFQVNCYVINIETFILFAVMIVHL